MILEVLGTEFDQAWVEHEFGCYYGARWNIAFDEDDARRAREIAAAGTVYVVLDPFASDVHDVWRLVPFDSREAAEHWRDERADAI